MQEKVRDHSDNDGILKDSRGRNYERVELNGHWVEYRYLDANGERTHAVAFPRVPIVSDETIAAMKALDDAR